METATGRSTITRVTLDHVEVAGRKIGNVDAAIAKRGLKVSLLGQDVLSRMGSVRLSGDVVTID